jgi:hypothetical protein
MLANLFRVVVDRLKAVFAAAVAAEVEADALARAAERQAELLRLADRYAAEGLMSVAADLRRRAEALSMDRPAGGVLPAVAHLTGDAAETGFGDPEPAALPVGPATSARRKSR